MRFSTKRRNLVYAKTNYLCGYCGKPAGNNPHIEHMIPKSIGGNNDEDNLMLSCCECNIVKSNMNVEEFRIYISNLPNYFLEQIRFRVAKKFKQIKTTQKPIIFYFETLGDENGKTN